jgi:O-antigen ligase
VTAGEGARFRGVPAVDLRVALPLAAAFCAIAAAGAAIPLSGQPLLVFAPIAVAASLAVAVRRMDLGIYVLIAATALNRYNFAVAGWNAKIENVAVLLVLAALAWRIASRREGAQRAPLVLVFGSLLAANVLSSFLNSADLYKSTRIIVRMALAMATMYVIAGYVSDRRKLIGGLRALLVVGAAASAFGIMALVVWHWFGRDIGIQQNPETGAISVAGTLWEANIFGSYVAGVGALSGGLLLSRTQVVDRRLLTLVFILAFVALVLSLTRGAWMGFATGCVLIVLFLRGARWSTVLLVAGLAVVSMLLVFRFDLGGAPRDVSARFATLSAMRADTTAVSRMKDVNQALSEWRQSPLLGWGTDGYHINHPQVLSRLPCPELGALYDTGLIGFALFVAALGALLFRCAVASTSRHDEVLSTLLGALTIAAIVQLIAFQVTDAFWLGFIWVYFGLMLGATRLISERARVEDRD